MLGALSIAIVLFAAPDAEASRKILRVAYASQYEWKEDKIKNATFDFEWAEAGENRKKAKWTHEARGSIVVVDGEVKRVHIPDAGRQYRGRVEIAMRWILRRFARAPFDERFKDAKFEPPEKMADGNTRIVVDGQRFLVADNRITGMEVNVGTAQKPSFVRVVLEPGDLGAGYGILAESLSHSFGGIQQETERKLRVATVDGIPVPKSYRTKERNRQGTIIRTLSLRNPRVNVEHAIAIDAASYERVKAAWERRYTWPANIRYEGKWSRDLDNATTKGRWTRNVEGEFQYLQGELELTLDEDVRLQQRWREGVVRSCTDDFRAVFAHLLPTPFDEAFPGCGFEPDPQEPENVIRVVGHPTILSLRLEDGAIVGRLTEEFGATEWWEYKLKKVPGDKLRIERMTRKIGKKKRTAKFAYSTKKGVQVLKSMQRIVAANAWGGGAPDDVGVIKYSLKRLFVQVK